MESFNLTASKSNLANLIYSDDPADWRDLEARVWQILAEVGCHAQRGKEIALVRGTAAIDVVAIDDTRNPPQLILCECKKWKKRVSKETVHAFRTVISDSGANVGYIISNSGFQSGAREAAALSNVHLTSWREFQNHFYDRWMKSMSQLLEHICDIIYELVHFEEDDRYYNRLASVTSKQGGLAAYEEYDFLVKKFHDLHWSSSHLLGAYGRARPREYFDELLDLAPLAYREHVAYLTRHTKGLCGSAVLLDTAAITRLRRNAPTKEELVREIGYPIIDRLRPHETWEYRASRTTFYDPKDAVRDLDLFRPLTFERTVTVAFSPEGRVQDLDVKDRKFRGLPY